MQLQVSNLTGSLTVHDWHWSLFPVYFSDARIEWKVLVSFITLLRECPPFLVSTSASLQTDQWKAVYSGLTIECEPCEKSFFTLWTRWVNKLSEDKELTIPPPQTERWPSFLWPGSLGLSVTGWTIGSGLANRITALSLTSRMPLHSSAECCWETELSVHRSHYMRYRGSCAVTTLASVSHSMKQPFDLSFINTAHCLMLTTILVSLSLQSTCT